jgi:phospholipid/cholesterol/gamma-HCH transport system substrate-binding protein
LLARVDTLSIELTAVARKVNSGDGTTAKLINERKLYDETRAAVREIALLVREVRNDPKKFFKVSVF